MLMAQSLSGDALKQALTEQVTAEAWPYKAMAIRPEDMLLVDEGAADIVSGCCPEGMQEPVLCTKFDPSGLAVDARVFVLMQSGEREAVLNLQTRYPEISFVSVTYGEATKLAALKPLVRSLDITILVSSPVSGADYLEALINANKAAQICRATDDIISLWGQYADDYSFIRQVLGRARQKKALMPKKPICLVLDIDEFVALHQSGVFAHRTFKRVCDSYDLGCIYMMRRNKALHAASIKLLQGSNFRSLRAATSKGLGIGNTQPELSALRSIVLWIIGLEIRFERFLSNLSEVRVICFEELQDNPAAVYTMLALFLGIGSPKKIRVINAAPYDLEVPWSKGMQADFKADVQEFLGVKRNDVGSYASTLFSDQRSK